MVTLDLSVAGFKEEDGADLPAGSGAADTGVARRRVGERRPADLPLDGSRMGLGEVADLALARLQAAAFSSTGTPSAGLLPDDAACD